MADIPHTPKLTIPDVGPLAVAAEDLMAYLRSGKNLSNNGVDHRERAVLEKAMEAIYGPNIWKEIQQHTKDITC